MPRVPLQPAWRNTVAGVWEAGDPCAVADPPAACQQRLDQMLRVAVGERGKDASNLNLSFNVPEPIVQYIELSTFTARVEKSAPPGGQLGPLVRETCARHSYRSSAPINVRLAAVLV